MNQEYAELAALKNNSGYQRLQALWAEQGQTIMKALNNASKLSGKDTNLRYYAGMWYGFDCAIGQLERALMEIERKMGNEKESTTVDELLTKIRGDKK